MQNGHDQNIEWVTIKVPVFRGDLPGFAPDRITESKLSSAEERDAVNRVYHAYDQLFPPSPVAAHRSRRPESVRYLFLLVAEAMAKGVSKE